MVLFTRRAHPADSNTTTAVGGHNNSTDYELRQPNKINRRERRQHDKGEPVHDNRTANSKPSFGQWIKVTWPDILTMILMGALGLGVSCRGMNLLVRGC